MVKVITAHPDYDQALLMNDSTSLWSMIIYTHLTHVNGAGTELIEMIRFDEQKKFNDIKQMPIERLGSSLNASKTDM
jgi:hypothetical protein